MPLYTRSDVKKWVCDSSFLGPQIQSGTVSTWDRQDCSYTGATRRTKGDCGSAPAAAIPSSGKHL